MIGDKACDFTVKFYNSFGQEFFRQGLEYNAIYYDTIEKILHLG